MRIRTDGDKSYRTDTIERVAKHYDRNKTDSLMLAADQIPSFHKAIADVLQMDSLTIKQRREIAERFNRARGINIEIETETNISIND